MSRIPLTVARASVSNLYSCLIFLPSLTNSRLRWLVQEIDRAISLLGEAYTLASQTEKQKRTHSKVAKVSSSTPTH